MTAGIVLAPDHGSLARDIADVLASRFGLRPARRMVIGVAGESGSGKSVTALALARELRVRGFSPETLHQDDYFRLPPRVNHAQRLADLAHVGPHEVDLAAMARHVAAFRAGDAGVAIPRVDYPGDRFDARAAEFGACDVLVVEGTYVLAGIADLDVRIFLEATHEDTRERRRVRNRDIDAPIIDTILGIEHAIVAPQAALANLVVDRMFALKSRMP